MKKIIISAFAILLLTASGAFAHPHVRFISRITSDFNGEQCIGCSFEWEFDSFFSGSMIHDFDKNHDGKFDEKEIKDIYKNGFSNLSNYGYFIYIRKSTSRINPEKVENFAAWQKDGKLFYSFYIPFKNRNFSDDFYIAVFDRSFYCSVEYGKPAVTIHQKSGVSPVYEITTNKKFPVYYNPAGSVDDLTIYKKWKPGLETAYPDEIHLYLKKPGE